MIEVRQQPHWNSEPLSELEHLAVAIARAVHAGPVDEVDVPNGIQSVVVNHEGTRVQLLRAYNIVVDEYDYRCHVLKSLDV